ncbi:MAG TPA: hypothetical protein VFN90_08830 [Gemmatimonadales bacterium]|nr:hypothetical protein [Gemmatimonadales bacterium]
MRFPALLVVAGFVLTACDAAPTTPNTLPLQASRTSGQLTAARAATQRFADFDKAFKTGYQTIFLNACFSDPTAGAMGYHYVNGALLDGTVDATAPEAVMYEPQADGSLTMVGLEYVVDAGQWDASKGAPTLFGETYAFNPAFNIYTLHVWLHRANPTGMFQPWNPAVSCANAPTTLKEHAH